MNEDHKIDLLDAIEVFLARPMGVVINAEIDESPKQYHVDFFYVRDSFLGDLLSASEKLRLLVDGESNSIVTYPLPMIDGVHCCFVEAMNGISMRLIVDYSISHDKFVARLEVLWSPAHQKAAA